MAKALEKEQLHVQELIAFFAVHLLIFPIFVLKQKLVAWVHILWLLLLKAKREGYMLAQMIHSDSQQCATLLKIFP